MCSLICKMESDPEIYRWNLGSVGYFCIKKGLNWRSWPVRVLRYIRYKWNAEEMDKMGKRWNAKNLRFYVSLNSRFIQSYNLFMLIRFRGNICCFPKVSSKIPTISHNIPNIQEYQKYPKASNKISHKNYPTISGYISLD